MKNVIPPFFVLFVIWTLSTFRVSGQENVEPKIVASIDLTMAANDKVPVTVNPDSLDVDLVVYRLPKVVQGTYAIGNYGRFIEQFKAFDYDGNELLVLQMDANSWEIRNAQNLDKIQYWVNDTFDMERSGTPNIPLSPSGTNIEPGVFVLNLHGFVGYFDSLKNSPYELEITTPVNFKYTSALKYSTKELSVDGEKRTLKYIAPRYFYLTDNPVMLGDLDVERFEVGNVNFELGVYSPNQLYTANKIKKSLLQMLKAQVAYLKDFEGAKNYSIIVYLSDGKEDSPKGFGGLEHNTSTVIVMPEYWEETKLYSIMFDMMAHEFFHIVTPMTIHSEDIHYFNYNKPTFSKHLWLYEGVTEYFSKLFKVDQHLVSEEDFYGEMAYKIKDSKKFNDSLSFTTMSENILTKKFKVNYPNVYRKGALIAMCLDILMREESNGKRSLLSLIKELSEKYGKNNPFMDDELIEDITEMTYPSIGSFMRKHVVGPQPINYQEYLDKVGLIIQDGHIVSVDNPEPFKLRLRNVWLNKNTVKTTLIENVNVIPMHEENVLEHQDVLIENGKIMDIRVTDTINPKTPVDLLIDGTDKYLIPGLSEMHYHWRNNDRNIETEFKLLLANGITTVRNMGEYVGQDHIAIRDKINKGHLFGPNYYTTGPYLQADRLQTIEDVIAVVRQHKDRGYDFIKIGDGREIAKEVYLNLLEEAQRSNIPVIGHAQHKLPLEFSLRMKSIEHVEEFIYIFNTSEDFTYLNHDLDFLNAAARQIKDSGVYVAPTLVIFEMITQYLDEERFTELKANDLAKYLREKDAMYWLSDENHYRADFANGKDRIDLGMDPLEFFESYYEWMKVFTKILSEYDIPMLSGSDTFGMVIPGFSLHEEFEFLQEVGLTPYEILKSSTIVPARYLDVLASEGTISEGKNANLVLLNKNPLEDIGNTKSIEGVMLKGTWFSRDKLDTMLLEVEMSND
ncbi:M61 family metallopeptidase [[Muricauda] lutisoli]|uniref:Amidohydrolase family protein n=1 Tax=[Muricauda] lutisoli TaxID=2816035 RepID=A0ABS3EYP5_9FLAO|nr:amidohydrolase family protein [[Muricauda] lutisoli]MBO0331381.1 amidohydrolase family protein [[Muricauda] lutisoli]